FERLVEAFCRAKQTRGVPHKLVIVGSDSEVTAADLAGIAAQYSMTDSVICTGGIPHSEVWPLYAAADACAYVSLHETFGHPLLESMAMGCPVLASDASCIPEICGSAALMVDATSVDELMQG